MTRTSIATDNFNRASLGTDWTQMNVGNAGSMQIVSSVNVTGQYGLQAGVDTATARWVGAGSYTDDQYSVIKLVNPLANGGAPILAGVIVRASGNAGTRSYYEAFAVQDSGTTPTTKLVKWVSGTRTVLHSASNAWAANDTIELEAEGTTIRVLKNGTALGGSFTQTDSSIATGVPGITSTSNALGDDWEGGNLTSADITAPTLTSPTGTQTGSTTASGTVSTDEGNGTLYYLASTNATETAATVKAASSQAVSGTGSQSVSFTGLTASTTYYAHYVHTDAAANDSTVSNSASFTTAAASSAKSPAFYLTFIAGR